MIIYLNVYIIPYIAGNFGEVLIWRFGEFSKVINFKITNSNCAPMILNVQITNLMRHPLYSISKRMEKKKTTKGVYMIAREWPACLCRWHLGKCTIIYIYIYTSSSNGPMNEDWKNDAYSIKLHS